MQDLVRTLIICRGEMHRLLIYKMNLDRVNVGRVILVLGGFLS
jgi:hypothetical protein